MTTSNSSSICREGFCIFNSHLAFLTHWKIFRISLPESFNIKLVNCSYLCIVWQFLPGVCVSPHWLLAAFLMLSLGFVYSETLHLSMCRSYTSSGPPLPHPFWWVKKHSSSSFSFLHLSQSFIANTSLWFCSLLCILILVLNPWVSLLSTYSKMPRWHPLGMKSVQKQSHVH